MKPSYRIASGRKPHVIVSHRIVWQASWTSSYRIASALISSYRIASSPSHRHRMLAVAQAMALSLAHHASSSHRVTSGDLLDHRASSPPSSSYRIASVAGPSCCSSYRIGNQPPSPHHRIASYRQGSCCVSYRIASPAERNLIVSHRIGKFPAMEMNISLTTRA